VLSDGVFPVSGALAPAPEYLEIVQDYDGLLCLDDAHGTGVLGENGRGTLEYHGIDSGRCYASHTLSKALGAFGGLIPGSKRIMEELNRNSMVQYGASTPPLPIAAAASQALALARNQPELRHRLWANVAKAREGMRSLGWSVGDTPVPIIYLGPRPGLDIARFQAELFERDLCIAYVPFYSDTPGGALRIAIFAMHTADQIDRLIYEMGRLFRL
jgi:glycine C-acetyltransferase/8-amino-7-oxononanoate synthase